MLETEYITLTIENNILVGKFKSDVKLNLDIAKQMVQDRLDFCQGRSYPVLSDIRGIKTASDNETRQYLQSTRAREGVLAGAILVDSVFTSYLGNIFLRVSYKKKTLPTKLFTEKSSAIDWLKNFVE